LKKNVQEEIPEDMRDYLKGSSLVILEEFLISLSRLPEAYIIPFIGLNFVFGFLYIILDKILYGLELTIFRAFTLPKTSFLQFFMLGITATTVTID
jgi:hypothetical protein